MSKKIFFLITIISMFIFNLTNVHAANARFYESEYIYNIYLSKYRYDNHTTYFQTARVFRKEGTNEFAYCIEPFRFFEEGYDYTETITPNNLSNKQIDKIKLIAHFGYNYKNHTDKKWYAITQYMIWQETNNNIGEVFFTDTLGGNKITPYESEINEINNLISNYNKSPLSGNREYTVFIGNNLTIEGNDTLNAYKTNEEDIKIEDNKIITKVYDTEGIYEYKIYRDEETYNKPIIFYQSPYSQSLMETGDLDKKEINLKVKVVKADITINKYDKDTLELTPQGEALLDGAIYEVYNSSNIKIGEIEIKNNTGVISIQEFGKYYVKEKEPGIGYTKDENIYEVEITEENTNVILDLTNKVIEKNIKIIKKYGDGEDFSLEEGITFEIYNINNELVKTVTTDEFGEVSFTLPYGEYKIVQINSTEGYKIVAPFNIEAKDEEDKIIELKDYKIPVPDTKTKRNLIELIFRFLYIIIC